MDWQYMSDFWPFGHQFHSSLDVMQLVCVYWGITDALLILLPNPLNLCKIEWS